MPPEPKMIFVVGTARSGTTYLARALSLPREIAYWEESGMFCLYGSRKFPWTTSCLYPRNYPGRMPPFDYVAQIGDLLRRKDRLRELLESLWRHAKLESFDLKPSNPLVAVQGISLTREDTVEIAKLQGSLKRSNYRNTISSLMQQFATLSGKSTLVEKTPKHLGFVPQIHATFPQAKIVCIVRDKKDSAASYLKHFSPPDGLLRKLRTESQDFRSFLHLCAKDARVEAWVSKQPYCYTVSFDEFVREPFQQANAIYHWLGLPISLEPYRQFYRGRNPTSHWDQLTDAEKSTVDAILSETN